MLAFFVDLFKISRPVCACVCVYVGGGDFKRFYVLCRKFRIK